MHFAVDTEAVFMTTRLAGTATHFLQFNRGWNGGAGNPPDPAGKTYRTGYLWEEVLQRDSLLDLLARFVHLEEEEKRDDQNSKVRAPNCFNPEASRTFLPIFLTENQTCAGWKIESTDPRGDYG